MVAPQVLRAGGKALPDKGMATALVSNKRPRHGEGAEASPGGREAALAPDRHPACAARPLTSALLGEKKLGEGKAECLAQSPKAK